MSKNNKLCQTKKEGCIVSVKLPSGTYDSTFDEKNRVIIPAPLREYYKGKLVVTQGNLLCVCIFLPEKWKEYQERVQIAFNKKEIDYKQYRLIKYTQIYAAREDVEIDQKSGRIPVASAVRTYAGLINKNCLVISTEDCLELWDSDYYYKYLKENWDSIQDASNKIGTLSAGDETNDKTVKGEL